MLTLTFRHIKLLTDLSWRHEDVCYTFWHDTWYDLEKPGCSDTGKFSLDDSELSIFLQRCELLENQPDHYWCFQIHDLFICMEFIHQASSFLSCKHSLYNCHRYKIQYFIKDYCYIQCFSLMSHMKSKFIKKTLSSSAFEKAIM